MCIYVCTIFLLQCYRLNPGPCSCYARQVHSKYFRIAVHKLYMSDVFLTFFLNNSSKFKSFLVCTSYKKKLGATKLGIERDILPASECKNYMTVLLSL
jgi:hypothetical protein